MWEVACTDFVGYTLFEWKDSWLKRTKTWFFSWILLSELSFLVVGWGAHTHLCINAQEDKIHSTLWSKQMLLFCYSRVQLAKSNKSRILKWKLSSQKTRAMWIPDNSQAWDIQNHIRRAILGVCHGEVSTAQYAILADTEVAALHSSIFGVGILSQIAKQTY